MRKYILMLTMLLGTVNLFASDLSNLPFNIKIGVTRFDDLKNRGVCLSRIEVTGGIFRCSLLDMAGGSFRVTLTQDEVVNMLVFQASGKLPSKWKALGLKFSSRLMQSPLEFNRNDISSGTSLEEMKAIIKKENATEINVVTTFKNSLVLRQNLNFVLDGLSYSAKFEEVFETTDDLNNVLKHNDFGLTRIDVSESF